MFFITYVFAGQVEIVSQLSCRASAIFLSPANLSENKLNINP